ncbi:MAG: inositol monophosphatase family protein [Bacteroidota bacterium]|nr:inositol monophosphatase family protein [Bacteroidota bacterium]MDP4232007.1 inositol monophosphatase family protein [Bacteroidota bacterium]MDP4241286.1 inositol monophosphatase family protein [Bacteroidota bacterium]MDP4286678.1 inositol monophosphatase family protein [Bacteroidota bacterium]
MGLIEEYLALAVEMAQEAGDYANAINRSELLIMTKSNPMDLVTEVDKRNEDVIREAIHMRYPDHEFLGEESADLSPKSDRNDVVRWIVDPIDGTVNYAHGLPIWCVSIGVEVNGRVECGAIYNPNLHEMFATQRGHGAYLNGKRLHVSQQNNPSQSLFVTGFPYNVNEDPEHVIEQFVAFLRQGLVVRRLGSAALDLANVAAGRFDGFWEVGLSPWDTSAGQLMVREAGGRVTHYDGSDYDIHRRSIVATSGVHHEKIMSILKKGQH